MNFRKRLLCRVLLGLNLAAPSAFAQTSLFRYALRQGLKQGGLLLRSEKISELLKRENLDSTTEHYLRLSQDVIRFAEEKAGMKTGRSYRRYVNIRRPWVTQVLTAARKDKLEPYLFRYPVLGNLPYKGFFDEEDAKVEESELRQKGLDVERRGVEAFSTLGFLPDPLISSMFSGEARFIELLFHELTHLNFYFESQADFNEAFATWMGLNLALEYLDTKPSLVDDIKAAREEIVRNDIFERQFTKKIRLIVQRGKDFYRNPKASEKREEYFAWIRAELAKEKGLERLSKWNWNNALVLSLGTYYELIPTIEKYAQAHKLSPRNFLALVVGRGEKIVSEVTAQN